MFQNTAFIAGFAVVSAFLGGSAGFGSLEVYNSLTAKPKPFSMLLDRLEYNDGVFTQSFHIEGGQKETLANWTAEIKRGNLQLCSAGGTAPYSDKSNGGASSFTVKQWAGKNCPDNLVPGDIATAIWEYRGHDGLFRTISAKLVIGRQHANNP